MEVSNWFQTVESRHQLAEVEANLAWSGRVVWNAPLSSWGPHQNLPDARVQKPGPGKPRGCRPAESCSPPGVHWRTGIKASTPENSLLTS